MVVDWKVSNGKSPILFRRIAEQRGVTVRHWRVLPGELMASVSEEHEINVVLDGAIQTFKHTSGGKNESYRQTPGTVCLLPAGQTAAGRWFEEFECVSISIAPAMIAQAMPQIPANARIELVETSEANDPLVQDLALALLAETGERAVPFYAESLAQTLLLHILKRYAVFDNPNKPQTSGLSGYKLKRVKEFIEAHLEDEITLGVLAQVAGLSQYHFAREFKRATNSTPGRFLMQRRIERAKSLLARRELPLIEVSARSGFKNQSHFTTLFREFTALTPKAWRESKAG